MKKLTILLIISVIIGAILLYFLFFTRKEVSAYNFILHFDEAQKVNFEKGSELDKFLPTRTFLFNEHLFKAQVYLLFSQNVNILTKSGNDKSDPKEKIGNAGFRFIFPSKGISGGASFVFKKKDELNYWSAQINLDKNVCNLQIFRVKNGLKEQLDRISCQNSNNKTSIIMIVFFRDFLMVLNESKILFQMKNSDLNETGRIGFDIQSKSSADFVVKFAKMSREIESYLLNWYSKNYPSAPDHKFNYHQDLWNRISFKPFLIISGKQNSFLRRLKIGNDTRPAIFMKMNSKLSYDLNVPKKGILEFYLSIVPVYVTDLNRLKFTMEVKQLGSGNIKKFNLDFSKRPRISQRFVQYKLDLNEFGEKKCEVAFKFSTSDGCLKNEEEKIILALASPVIYPERQKEELNVIFISLDTLRASNLGCYGYSRETSSNIDSFAANGIRFANATASSNWTLSSHLSMFTAMYPFETGFLKIADTSAAKKKEVSSFSGSFISDDLPTIAQYLQKAGYKTIGIHGGGFVSEFYGFDKGFDGYNKMSVSVKGAVDAAIKILEKNKKQKTFMFFHTYEIHEPYKHDYFISQLSPSESSFRNRVIARYDSGIRFTDFEIGRLIDWLKKNGLFEKTLIIITSDHGENFDYLRKNPEAGTHGITLYDVETHIPLIVGGAARFNKSRVIKDQVSSVDILPTIMDFLDIPLERDVRGTSLMPLIDGKDIISRMAYSEAAYTVIEKKSIRSLNYKMIATIAIKESDGSLDINYELYNLRNDKKEKVDVLHLEPGMAKDYMKFLNKIIKSVEENRARLDKTRPAVPTHDKELLDDLKGLGYIGN